MNALSFFELQQQGIGSASADIHFDSVSIDTRTLKPGDVFVAIMGPNFDGHDFVKTAYQKGAAGVVVQKLLDVECPQLLVKDTHQALTAMATIKRSKFSGTVIGVTGSCGKTTVKSLIHQCLGQTGFATLGNLNNHYGVPLTLLQLQAHHEYAVVEMGMNAPGEIAPLAAIAQPQIALVTMVAPVHIEAFDDCQGIAKEKACIYEGLVADGLAIINADDTYRKTMEQAAGDRRRFYFGIEQTADCSANNIEWQADQTCRFNLCIDSKQEVVHLPLIGRHQVMNALAAASVAYCMGVQLAEIATRLSQATPTKSRLVRAQGIYGCSVIDDSYNANPAAFKAAIDILAQAPKQKVLVLGDMGELGEHAKRYHQEVGAYAKAAGIDYCFAIGPLSRFAVSAFGQGAIHCDSIPQLLTKCIEKLDATTTVLVKASRSMRLEQVVSGLIKEEVI